MAPSSLMVSCHFSPHCSIHLWYPLQICCTISVSCFLSMPMCFISVFCHFCFFLSARLFFLSFIFLVSSLSAYLTWDYSAVHHHPPLPIPRTPCLLCSPSPTPSTPFLSPPLCHPSIKTPTDGPEPSAQATFCPLFFSPALHAKRRPIKVRLLSFFHSVVLFSVCLHSDSLGSLIKTLYFLLSLLHFFSAVHQTFLFFCYSYSFFLFHLSAITCLNSSLFISLFLSSFGPCLMSLHHSHCFHPFVILFFPHLLSPTLSFHAVMIHIKSCDFSMLNLPVLLCPTSTSLNLSPVFLHISLYTGNSLCCSWQEVRICGLKKHALCSSSVLMMLSCPELLLCLKPVNLDWRLSCACARTSA